MLDTTAKVGVTSSSPAIRQNILTLLDKLPSENLLMVETFIRFMRDQQFAASPLFTYEQTQRRYPTVPIAAVDLDTLIGIMPDVDGDALADTD